MAQPVLQCENAKYISGMMIWCQKTQDYCAFQYYMPCKGWFALTPSWAGCTMRDCGKEIENHERHSSDPDPG